VPAERSDIRPGVNLHLLFAAAQLSDGDRAALQSLVPLSSALGAGTIFSLFVGTRRGTALRLFEVFAIVTVLALAALTAAISIDLLHEGLAITGKELTQTATPLIIATVLIVVVSVFNRINESFDRLLLLLPFACGAILAALLLVLSSFGADPSSALWRVGLILAVGLVFSVAGWAIDRNELRSGRRGQVRRVLHRTGLGFTPVAITLRPALPEGGPSSQGLTGWARGDSRFLAYEDAARLRDLVRARWDALAAGEARNPVGEMILLDIELEHWVRTARRPGRMQIKLLRPGAKKPEETKSLTANGDRLFDVTDLVA
jgi:hypothetical protein